MTGGRRGYCAGASAPAAVPWGSGRGVDGGPGRGGRGFRNQYYATGLTGWQRGQMDAPAQAPAQQNDRVAQLEARLEEALARLARLEGAE